MRKRGIKVEWGYEGFDFNCWNRKRPLRGIQQEDDKGVVFSGNSLASLLGVPWRSKTKKAWDSLEDERQSPRQKWWLHVYDGGGGDGEETLFHIFCYIMQNAGLDEAQAGIKIAGRNINNLRSADDTTFTAESEELEHLDESERGEWRSWLKTQHSEN